MQAAREFTSSPRRIRCTDSEPTDLDVEAPQLRAVVQGSVRTDHSAAKHMPATALRVTALAIQHMKPLPAIQGIRQIGQRERSLSKTGDTLGTLLTSSANLYKAHDGEAVTSMQSVARWVRGVT